MRGAHFSVLSWQMCNPWVAQGWASKLPCFPVGGNPIFPALAHFAGKWEELGACSCSGFSEAGAARAQQQLDGKGNALLSACQEGRDLVVWSCFNEYCQCPRRNYLDTVILAGLWLHKMWYIWDMGSWSAVCFPSQPIPGWTTGIKLLHGRSDWAGSRNRQPCAQGPQMPSLWQGMGQHLNLKGTRKKTPCFSRGVLGRDGLFEQSSLWGQDLTCLHESEGKMVILRGCEGED